MITERDVAEIELARCAGPVSIHSMIERFARPAVVERAESRIASEAAWRTSGVAHHLGQVSLEQLVVLGPTTLGHHYARYMQHFGLQFGFFPRGPSSVEEPSPLERAADMVGDHHDFVHVLGEYETSDDDEAAVQSFVCGQAPAAWSLFLRRTLASTEIHQPRYKHLRDVVDADLVMTDFRRGVAAGCVVALPFGELLEHPMAELRRSIRPRESRPSDAELRNSCQGVTERRFFV